MSEQKTLIEEPKPEAERETCGGCRFVWAREDLHGLAWLCCIEPGQTPEVWEGRTECWRHQRREP